MSETPPLTRKAHGKMRHAVEALESDEAENPVEAVELVDGLEPDERADLVVWLEMIERGKERFS